jgi:hypothetical protein
MKKAYNIVEILKNNIKVFLLKTAENFVEKTVKF